MARSPVTPDDLDHVIQLAVDTLRAAPADAWDRRAGTLEWTCWETAEHLADDVFGYATQLGPRKSPTSGYVPTIYEERRPGGPENTIWADPSAGPEGLLQVLEACGALLVSMARTASPDIRAHHGYGASDPEGFAAMGLVEALVHVHDIASGMGLAWDPPADICARVLLRLFPDVPTELSPWPALLWATGRVELPGHPKRTKWRWYGEPR